MRRPALISLFVMTFLWIGFVMAETKDDISDPRAFVPDAKTALRIAEAVWEARFGEYIVVKYRPYQVKLEEDVWIIYGTSEDGSIRGGGVPTIKISRENGKIIEAYLSK